MHQPNEAPGVGGVKRGKPNIIARASRAPLWPERFAFAELNVSKSSFPMGIVTTWLQRSLGRSTLCDLRTRSMCQFHELARPGHQTHTVVKPKTQNIGTGQIVRTLFRICSKNLLHAARRPKAHAANSLLRRTPLQTTSTMNDVVSGQRHSSIR